MGLAQPAKMASQQFYDLAEEHRKVATLLLNSTDQAACSSGWPGVAMIMAPLP
ncbi:hypothetical protein SAMN03159463_04518 [Mesorhizobium sp. NFR06]|jgi:hypothetical protein|nr:hypothetical protein SAMN03159463_04518 [Mesorhizobium sp. NFR06]